MPNRIKNILEEYVNGLLKMIGKNLKQVILYGSYARGEQDKNGEISDIDIMILVDLEEDKIKKLEKKVTEARFFREKSDYVDFYMVTKEECKAQIDTARLVIENAEKYINEKIKEF